MGYLTSLAPGQSVSAAPLVPGTTRICKQIAQENYLPVVTAKLPEGNGHVLELTKAF